MPSLSRKNRQLRAKLIFILVIALLVTLHCILLVKVKPYMVEPKVALEAKMEPVKEIKPRAIVSRGASRVYIGEFNVSAYTAGFESCQKLPSDPAYGITASGEKVQANHTIATDWGVLPKGTKVMIEGFDCIFVVSDKGGAIKGRKIDVYMEELEYALEFGRQQRRVWVVK